MDAREIRLECLRLALETARRAAELEDRKVVERARAYEEFVLGAVRLSSRARRARSPADGTR